MIELAFAAALMAQDTVILVQHRISRAELETGLPPCTERESGTPHQDCSLQTAGGGGFILTFEFSPLDDRREMIDATVRHADGTLAQTMSYATESFFYPSLSDLNGDGMEELLVPLETGNVNTTYNLAIGTEYGFEWTSYELNGYGIDPVADGVFMAAARDSAISRYIEFYRLEGLELDNIATVFLTYETVEDVDEGPDCSLVDGGEAEGEAYYCGLALNP